MRFIFTVTASGFVNAGCVEEALKPLNATYTVKIDGSPTQTTTRTTGRGKMMTVYQVEDIKAAVQANPTMTDRELAAKCNTSPATVERVRKGTHTLIKQGKVKPL